jgi:hypothetical protein
MALLKSGVLTGRKTQRQYGLQAALGLGCGLPLVAWGLYQYQAANWRLPDSVFVIPLWNYWGSVLVALGYIGLLLTLWKANVLRALFSRLAAVGRTAFSGYILETLICTTIFYGHGLACSGALIDCSSSSSRLPCGSCCDRGAAVAASLPATVRSNGCGERSPTDIGFRCDASRAIPWSRQ